MDNPFLGAGSGSPCGRRLRAGPARGSLGQVQIDVDTEELTGVAGAVRQAAAAVGGLVLPRAPDPESVAAGDALRMLLRVVDEQRHDLSAALLGAAVLVEAAAADYARAEARAAP